MSRKSNSITKLNANEFPEEVSDKFEANLTPAGRLNLLAIGLRLAPRKEAMTLCDAFLADLVTGPPLPSFVSAMDDARWHAGLASTVERKAFTLAHFQSLSPADQNAFLDHVSLKRGIAA